MASTPRYDAAVVGGGPVGCMAALALARKGARVVVFEANPAAAGRFAGEWLHPPAVEAMRALGVEVPASGQSGKGFVLFPDDGASPFVLPYTDGARGLAIEHHVLVAAVREAVGRQADIALRPHVRVERVEAGCAWVKSRGQREPEAVHADLIVGADGRRSVVREALGLEVEHVTSSRMAGLLLRDAAMPFEGFGHVLLGGPGPVLAYRIAPDLIRMCIDVPLHAHRAAGAARDAWMSEAYGMVLPPVLRAPFERALREGGMHWAAVQVRPRAHYGKPGMVLVGDAVGHHHPFTAAGMAMGFADALALADHTAFAGYKNARLRGTRVPEMLAVALYEVFADRSDETVAIRKAVYEMWRTPLERERTMRFLGCQDLSAAHFVRSFAKAMVLGGRLIARNALHTGHFAHQARVAGALTARARYLSVSMLREASSLEEIRQRTRGPLARALNVSVPAAEVVDMERRKQSVAPPAPGEVEVAVQRVVDELVAAQGPEGGWQQRPQRAIVDTANALRVFAASQPLVDPARCVRSVELGRRFMPPRWPERDVQDSAVAIVALDDGAIDARTRESAFALLMAAQHRDGSFGSGEAHRLRGLTAGVELGSIERTAACVEALAVLQRQTRAHWGGRVDTALQRAARNLRTSQAPDGSWRGRLGTTCAALKACVAAGAAPYDPAILKAGSWISALQRGDGGWGDTPTHRTAETAWAVDALLVARWTDWDSLERGVSFLLQQPTAPSVADMLDRLALVRALVGFEMRRRARGPAGAMDVGGRARLA